MREALLLGIVEEDLAATGERRAVVEHEVRLCREPHEEHVPHPPVGRAVVEEAIARPHVEVQPEGLQALQQRAAGAVHDAFRRARRAGREQDEHRVLEGQLGVVDIRRLIAPQPLGQRDRLRDVGDVDPRVVVRHDHHLAQRRQLLGDGAHALERVVALAVVAVAVGAEQHFRLDLAEAVEHALDAEVGRARGPDDALRERRQRQHAGFGNVGNEGRHAVAGAQSQRLQRLRGARDVARQIRIADAPLEAGLVPQDERVAPVAATQQVLREIEARFREPVRAGHLVAIGEHGRALAGGDDAAEVPAVGPELFRVVDRPLIELRVAVGVELALADHLARELRDLRLLDRALARLPENFRYGGCRHASSANIFAVMIILPEALAHIRQHHRMAEDEALKGLRARQPKTGGAIEATALRLAQRVRARPPGPLSAESFLRHYGLSTRQGVALMCVAEALLRIPDAATADALLREKLSQGDWAPSGDDSLLASAADWALLLTGKLARWHDEPSPLKHVVARLGEPVVRAAVRQAMRILAEQFVLAETIEDAVRRGAERTPYVHSYDMLGEAARTAADAAHYMELYARAIGTVRPPDTISIKLSALHPRFEEAKRARVFVELLPRLKTLAQLATDRGVGFTIDAEESERLELTLDLHAALAQAFTPGLAVQAYQKRAVAVCEWLVTLGRKSKRRLPIRLVKGAYWDSEVKRAQQLGMPDYPVFTRKAVTDLSYVACANTLLAPPDAIYPAFATHNCPTVHTNPH